MNLVFDAAFLRWFSGWSREFDWDSGNLQKNEKHGILRERIEAIFDSPVYIAGKILESDEEPRWLLLGEAASKGWTMVVTTRGRRLRIISCRRQRKKEEQYYESFKQNLEEEH